MIARQIILMKKLSAVLALVLIPCVDIFTRVFSVFPPEMYKSHQPDNRRDFHGYRDRTHDTAGFLYNLYLVEENEFNRSLPVDDIQRLVGSIQQQDLFEEISLLSGIVPIPGSFLSFSQMIINLAPRINCFYGPPFDGPPAHFGL